MAAKREGEDLRGGFLKPTLPRGNLSILPRLRFGRVQPTVASGHLPCPAMAAGDKGQL